MVEPDDDTHTDAEEIDEDARIIGNEPDEEAIDEPTTDSEQEARETTWMAKEGMAIGIVSIAVFLLVAVAMMQVTGLVDFFSSTLGQVGFFAVLALATIAAFAWSRRGV